MIIIIVIIVLMYWCNKIWWWHLFTSFYLVIIIIVFSSNLFDIIFVNFCKLLLYCHLLLSNKKQSISIITLLLLLLLLLQLLLLLMLLLFVFLMIMCMLVTITCKIWWRWWEVLGKVLDDVLWTDSHFTYFLIFIYNCCINIIVKQSICKFFWFAFLLCI